MTSFDLLRTYHPKTTIGEIWRGNTILSYSIELPWQNNSRQISCIPEGTYRLVFRHSPKFGRQMIALETVPGRTGILLHSANNADNTNAPAQLQGCIAPVTWVRFGNDTVRGLESQRATDAIYDIFGRAIRSGGAMLRISKKIEINNQFGKI